MPDVQWFADPTKITVGMVLLAGIIAYHRVTRWYFDAFVKRSDEELARTLSQCQSERDRNERLLAQLERLSDTSQILAEKLRRRA